MSAYVNEFLSPSHLLGKVEIPRNTYPTLRAGVRRSDPDNTSVVPYYSGVSSKTLTVRYSDASMNEQSEDIVISSNGYAQILTQINAVDPANLQAFDADGFICLRNLNAGGTHYLQVMPQAVEADDAAFVFGFRVDPFPGSLSYAGEIATAPGNRIQKNPQGTALLGRDESLSAQGINRAVAAAILLSERDRRDLTREVLVIQDVPVTLQNNSTVAGADGLSGGAQTAARNVFTIDDPTLRIPIHLVPTPTAGGDMLKEFLKLTLDGSEAIMDVDGLGQRFQIKSVHYSTNPTSANFRSTTNADNTFAVWGTPDNKSIFGTSDLTQKDKHSSVAITSIDGNIITCSGATFEDKFVQPGDTLIISGASNTSPWNHDGEYIVEEVWSNEIISVRPKLDVEPSVFPDNLRPSGLNPTGTGFGNVTIPIGFYLPASNLVFTLEAIAATGVTGWNLTGSVSGSFFLRMKVGKPFREVIAQEMAKDFSVRPDRILDFLRGHISDASGAHLATAINWSGAVPTWATTGESVSGSTIQAVLTSLVSQLGDATSPQTGATRIGSAAIAAVTNTAPNASLAAGNIQDQLLELLEQINGHMSDGGSHAGGGAGYLGSGNWADGTPVPASTIEQAIDRIVSDLAATTTSDDGAGKIGMQALPSWVGADSNPATSIYLAVKKVIDDLNRTGAGNDGAKRIGAAATSEIAATSVRGQIDELAAEWGRLVRSNTWSSPQTFNGSGGDTSSAVVTSATPSTRKLLWEATLTATKKARIYASGTGIVGTGFEFSINAVWKGTVWESDDHTVQSTKFSLTGTGMVFSQKDVTASTWADNAWDSSNIDFNGASARLKVIGETTFSSILTAENFAIFGDDVQINGLLANLGDSKIGTNADADQPRIQSTQSTVAERTLMMQWSGPSYHVRLYHSTVDGSSFELVINAAWNSTANTWARDTVSGTNSGLYRFYRNGIKMYHYLSSSANNWADASWSFTLDYDHIAPDLEINGSVTVDEVNAPVINTTTAFATGRYECSGLAGASSNSWKNALFGTNIPKVWARLTINGSDIDIENGFNIASASFVSTFQIEIFFAQDFTGATAFAPFFMSNEFGAVYKFTSSGNGASIRISAFDADNTNPNSMLMANHGAASFLAFGFQ